MQRGRDKSEYGQNCMSKAYSLPVEHSAREGHIRTPKKTKQRRSTHYPLPIKHRVRVKLKHGLKLRRALTYY
jgi:hypothetical protein